MTDTTPHLNLPFVKPAQAQKHLTVNAALKLLDTLTQAHVEGIQDSLPLSPVPGQRILVSDQPQGGLVDNANHLAIYDGGDWVFLKPKAGWRIWIQTQSELVVYDGAAWMALDFDTLNVRTALGINGPADPGNPLYIRAPRALFDHDGADHRVKINKAAQADVASLVYQSNYLGAAEMGLIGDDDFHITVSDDGAAFKTAMRISSNTGDVTFPQGTNRAMQNPSVSSAGGSAYIIGPPNLCTLSRGRVSITLGANRMHFCAVYVDRPTEILELVMSQTQGSSLSQAVTRAGIFHMGSPSGNNWSVGDLIKDFGKQDADVAGHKIFAPNSPVTLPAGWYLLALGTTGVGVTISASQWMTPGLLQYGLTGSANTSDFQILGMSHYLFDNDAGTVIQNGFDTTWQNNPVVDAGSHDDCVLQMVLPKWTRWA